MGGASGIGERIVRPFHTHCAKVCIADIRDDLSQRLCKTLGGPGPNIFFCHCDVTIETEISPAIDFIVDRFGALGIMVKNAGTAGPPCPEVRDFDVSLASRIFHVNVKGIFMGMKHVARATIPAKRGSIVSVSSMVGVVGGMGPHVSMGSKHAMLGLTRNVAAKLGKHEIRVLPSIH